MTYVRFPLYKTLKFFASDNNDWDAAAVLNTVIGGIPDGTVLIQIGVEAQAVRYRDDGTNPTASTGQRLVPGAILFYDSTRVQQLLLRFIGEAPGAVLMVTCLAWG